MQAMRKLLAYTVGFLFVAYIDVLGISVQWQVADGGNGHYYEQIAASVTWTQAMQLAANANYLGMPGHLVTIASSAENVFILTNVYVGNYAWIGFTDNEAFGGSESFGQSNPQVDGWVWVTGEPITFTGWYPGEPDNLNNEDFALFDTHAEPANGVGWNDDQSSSTRSE